MKRSAQVVLLLMGVSGVGAGAYALTPPRTNCVPQGAPPSAVAANPSGAPAAEPCPPRRQGSGIGSSGRSHFGSWSSSSSTSSSSRTSTSTAGRATSTVPSVGRSGTSSGGGVSHGGFGSTGHAASAGS